MALRLPRRMFMLAACAYTQTVIAQGPTTPLRVGVFPTVSPAQLLTNYQPFRSYLARELGRPVEIFTAKDFPSFHRDTLAGSFDLVLTAAHLARLAQRDAGWLPLAHYTEDNRATLLTSKSQPITAPKDLAGRKVAVANRTALVVIIALHWLAEKGLRPGRDFEILGVPTFSAAAHAVQSGEAALGIVSTATLKQVPPSVAAGVQVFQELPSIPYTWAIAPALHAEGPRVREVLVRFTDQLPEGKKFYDATNHGAIEPMSEEFLRSIDPYVDETRRLVQPAR